MGHISRTLVYTTLIYLVALLYGLNFLLSAAPYGLLSSDYLLIFAIILLPLLFYILYALRDRYGPLHEHEGIIEKLIFATAVISTLFVTFIIVPITYA